MRAAVEGRTATVRQWAGRRLLSTTVGKRSGIFGITVLPAKLTMPLRRTELDPLPQLTEMRQTGGLVKLSRVWGMNVWLVTGIDPARAVLNDTTSYSTNIRSLVGAGADPVGGLGFTDPPDHTRLRKILTPEFTLRRLSRLQPRIEQIVEDRIQALEAGGDVADLVTEFAFPVPFLMICDLLGLPAEERERFRSLGHDRFDVKGGGAGTFGAVSQSRGFLLDVVSRQRADPGEGLIGSILREHGDDIDDTELAGLADGIFTGGYETSASMLALGTLALLRDPAAYERIRTDPDAVGPIVEELLRYLSPVQIAFPRFARRDVELLGTTVKAGDVVVCSLTSANRDDAFGAGTDQVSFQRPTRSHLAFGHGIHRCIGSELARMELRVAFRALAARFPRLELAVPPSELQFRELSLVDGVESLPVRLDGARAGAESS